MKVAKASKDDLQYVLDFFHAAELALEREKFGLGSSEENWEDLDEDDADYKTIISIRKRIASDEGIKEGEVDNRILMFEFLKKNFNRGAASGWRRVYYAADILIDMCTDPTEDCLEWLPGVEIKHVENEM